MNQRLCRHSVAMEVAASSALSEKQLRKQVRKERKAAKRATAKAKRATPRLDRPCFIEVPPSLAVSGKPSVPWPATADWKKACEGDERWKGVDPRTLADPVLIASLDRVANEFASSKILGEAEMETLDRAVRDLRGDVAECISTSHRWGIHVYGSVATGLATSASDIDSCFVGRSEWASESAEDVRARPKNAGKKRVYAAPKVRWRGVRTLATVKRFARSQ
jgi:hypothetical protein